MMRASSEQCDCEDVVAALYADWYMDLDANAKTIVSLDENVQGIVKDAFRCAYRKGYDRPYPRYVVCPICKRSLEVAR